jgi:lysine-specific demethylase 8
VVETVSVPRLKRPPVAEFRRAFERPRRPAVLTGVMDSWPAMGRWSPEYFAEHLADRTMAVSTSEEDLPDDGPITPAQLLKMRVVKMPMGEYLEKMAARDRRFYASGVPLRPFLPALLDDLEVPAYREVGASGSPRMWMGSGAIGPLHYDATANLHGIVYGAKRFRLFSPRQLPLLYPCSMFSKIPSMSRASLSAPDYARFPRLRRARPTVVDLGPGDMIFIPPGWWHQVDTPDPTISIDFPGDRAPRLGRSFLRLIPSQLLRKVRGRLGR